MKKMIAIAASACLLSSCAAFAPKVIDGNERYVTVQDALGIPELVKKTADEHCAKFGRYARFNSFGGTGYLCSGSYSRSCSTYHFVE